MGTPNKYKNEYAQMAADILGRGKSKAAVCAALNITRPTFYDWCAVHSEFNDAVQMGMEKCQSYWEDVGEDGIKGNYEKFGASPWIFTMKNRFREDYKEDKQDDPSIATSIVEKLIDKLIE